MHYVSLGAWEESLRESEVHYMSTCFLERNPREARLRRKGRIETNKKSCYWVLVIGNSNSNCSVTQKISKSPLVERRTKNFSIDFFWSPVSHLWFAHVLTVPSSLQVSCWDGMEFNHQSCCGFCHDERDGDHVNTWPFLPLFAGETEITRVLYDVFSYMTIGMAWTN